MSPEMLNITLADHKTWLLTKNVYDSSDKIILNAIINVDGCCVDLEIYDY